MIEKGKQALPGRSLAEKERFFLNSLLSEGLFKMGGIAFYPGSMG